YSHDLTGTSTPVFSVQKSWDTLPVQYSAYNSGFSNWHYIEDGGTYSTDGLYSFTNYIENDDTSGDVGELGLVYSYWRNDGIAGWAIGEEFDMYNTGTTSGDWYGKYLNMSNTGVVSGDDLYGHYLNIDNNGTVDDVFGMKQTVLGGSATNAYGLYTSVTEATNNYGLYVNAGESYFGGNVGIGTTTPQAALSVVGDISASSTNGIDINPGWDTNLDIITLGVTGSPKLKWYDASNYFMIDNADFMLETSQSLGVGGVKMFTFWNGDGIDWLYFNDDSNNIDFIMEGNNEAHLFHLDASTDRIGIGTSTPAYLLDVYGNARIDGTLNVSGAITANLTGNADTATILATARTIAGVSFDGSANINLSSTGLSDTADLLYEAELNTFSELQSQIADETLLKAGTLTDTKYCIWDGPNNDVVCNSTPSAGGYPDYLSQIGDVGTTSLATTDTLTYQGTSWQSTSTLQINVDGTLEVNNSANGIDINPGSDIDVDLFTVGVTGAPNLKWDESSDVFVFNEGIKIEDSVAANYLFFIQNTNAIGQSGVRLDNDNSSSQLQFGVNGSAHASAPGLSYFWNTNNYGMRFGTNNQERMKITNDGKVGIGTSTPQAPLGITADANHLITRFEENSGGEYFDIKLNASGYLQFKPGAEANPLLEIPDDDPAGASINSIGLLGGFYHIGDTNTVFDFDDDRYDFIAGGIDMLSIRESAGQDIIVFNEGSEDVDIRMESNANTHAFFLEGSSGDIGIGTIPDTKLQVLDTGTQLKLSYDATASSTFAVDTNGDLTITASGGDVIMNDLERWTSLRLSTTTDLMTGTGAFVVSGATSTGNFHKFPASTWIDMECHTTAGTAGLQIGTSTAYMDYKSFSTTASSITFTTNNSLFEGNLMTYKVRLSADNVVLFCDAKFNSD
ncbi:hypothetical protein KAJ89_04075, partial [Candidatus Parcubacteria bacterium]|nr:hypothetical protein [Candidatus Parcubacteria bacterium]